MKNLLDRAKLFFSKDREFRSALHSIMGFYPHNIDLYRTAFAHKSQEYRSKRMGNKPLNNERLEFLGDAVLETVVSDIVFRHFPNKREGFLTNTRSKIVSRESLGDLAKELGIDRLIQSQTSGRSQKSYLPGNTFEALMGAIYLDRGFPYAFQFIEKRIMGTVLDLKAIADKEVNFKSKLLEWCQKNKIRFDFREKGGQGNNEQFHTTIVIEGLYAGDGRGYSKKDSHQSAAKEALTRMRREADFIDQIFRAKEQRTAMEANEMFCLPKIAEIEEELAKEAASPRKERGKKERSKKEREDKAENKQSKKHNERAERPTAQAVSPAEVREEEAQLSVPAPTVSVAAVPSTESRDSKEAHKDSRKDQPKKHNERAERAERATAQVVSLAEVREEEVQAAAPTSTVVSRQRRGKEEPTLVVPQERKERSSTQAEPNHAAHLPEQTVQRAAVATALSEELVAVVAAVETHAQAKAEQPTASADLAAVVSLSEVTAPVADVVVQPTMVEEAVIDILPVMPTAPTTAMESLAEANMGQSIELLEEGVPVGAPIHVSPSVATASAETVVDAQPFTATAPMGSPTLEKETSKPAKRKMKLAYPWPIEVEEEEEDLPLNKENQALSTVLPVAEPEFSAETATIVVPIMDEAVEDEVRLEEPKQATTAQVETPTEMQEEAQAAATPQQQPKEKTRRGRRAGTRQSAEGFTNTILPPAEQSHRAEKHERRQQEAREQRAIERARRQLAPDLLLAEELDSQETATPVARQQPAADGAEIAAGEEARAQNHRRRRGGRRGGRRKGKGEGQEAMPTA